MRTIKTSFAEEASYVVRYYGRFMTEREKSAYRHLTGTLKSTHARSDLAAQQDAKNDSHYPAGMLSDDPEVLLLASAGIQEFLENTAQRILKAHGGEIVLNHCPKCGALAKTPKARQCRFCRHDWHDGDNPQ